MNKRTRTRIGASTGLAMLALALCPGLVAPAIAAVGQAAPAFAMPATDGKRIDMAALRGKRAALIVFWASW